MKPNLFSKIKTFFQDLIAKVIPSMTKENTTTDSHRRTRIWNQEFFQTLRKGIVMGFGFMLGMFGTGVMAVAVTGTIKTWATNDKLSATDLNTAFTSLKTAIEGITSSQWTTSGSNIYYNTGKVGIGINPFSKLHIYGTNYPEILAIESTASAELLMSRNNTDYLKMGLEGSSAGNRMNGTLAYSGFLGTFSNQPLTFHTNNQFRAIISSSGNIGIGTTNPLSKFHVLGTGQNTANISTSNGLGATLLLQDSDSGSNNGGSVIFGTVQGFFAGIKGLIEEGTPNTAGALSFSTRNSVADANLTERMRITASGNIGIGYTNPTYNLQVNGSIAGTSAYTNLSDGRFKENIQNIFGALDKIERLRGVSYTWKQKENKDLKFNKGRDLGFIGQEVEKIIPEAVSKDDKGILSLAYSNIIPVVVEAIKELRRNQDDKIDGVLTSTRSVTEKLSLVTETLQIVKDENIELKIQLSDAQKHLSDLKKENTDFKLSVMQQLKEIQENRYAKK
ncbi:MAG: tail fiber domain-containing protein [Leptospiraceae bacterium]|nr:tail fiber domain-containing protein [Leptospiraceae bacterium]MCP5512424.1 tail fiber domain-containing protein [Leptospiraceae bacterium]